MAAATLIIGIWCAVCAIIGCIANIVMSPSKDDFGFGASVGGCFCISLLCFYLYWQEHQEYKDGAYTHRDTNVASYCVDTTYTIQGSQVDTTYTIYYN